MKKYFAIIHVTPTSKPEGVLLEAKHPHGAWALLKDRYPEAELPMGLYPVDINLTQEATA